MLQTLRCGIVVNLSDYIAGSEDQCHDSEGCDDQDSVGNWIVNFLWDSHLTRHLKSSFKKLFELFFPDDPLRMFHRNGIKSFAEFMPLFCLRKVAEVVGFRLFLCAPEGYFLGCQSRT